MTDYEKATGTGGRMVIRDDLVDGVSFYVEAGFDTTFKDNMPFSWIVNGAGGSSTKDYPTGSPLLLLKSFVVTTSQTVTFTLGATGTSGLGGPTTFTHAISRATAPAAPVLDAPTMQHTGAVLRWADGSNGGSAITSRAYQVSTSSAFTGATWVSTGITLVSGKYQATISGLIPGTTYYFRARATNAKGDGTPSAAKIADTLAGARIRVAGVWKNAVPYIRVGGVWKVSVPYVKVAGTWKATIG